MAWAIISTKSRVEESENAARIRGEGSVRSNDARTERDLAYDFAGTVDRNTELAYEVHQRARGRQP